MNELQIFFSQLNQFFDKVYVITLRRAADRHEHIRKELQHLNYEFFYGQDKLEFSIDDLKQKSIYNEDLARRHHRYGKPLQIGQICCAWSHAEVYRHIVENNYQKVLILEDDVVIDKTQVKKLPAILKELPSDWELVYLGFAKQEAPPQMAFFKKIFYHLLRSVGAIRFSHKTIRHLYPKKIAAHVYEAGYHDCTHAYGLTLSGAKKLLHLQTPISFVADNLLAHAATNEVLKSYVVLPKIVYQQYQVGTSSASYLND
jgi:glycosyl transferase family 25